jgi:hypothetical protein
MLLLLLLLLAGVARHPSIGGMNSFAHQRWRPLLDVNAPAMWKPGCRWSQWLPERYVRGKKCN